MSALPALQTVPFPARRGIGTVLSLALRPPGSPAPRSVAALDAIAGTGLGGDRHADPLSPRQVLLAGAADYGRHGLPPLALRENVLLDIDTADLASGTLLRIGSDAVLALTFHCEACAQLDRHAPGLAAAIGTRRGMLARVVSGGRIRTGDAVATADGGAAAWPDDWRERVALILPRVPDGMVLEYRQLARLAGVQAVYCRAFPRLAARLGYGHVAVPAAYRPEVARWGGDGLFG
jgi:hypothetical protein